MIEYEIRALIKADVFHGAAVLDSSPASILAASFESENHSERRKSSQFNSFNTASANESVCLSAEQKTENVKALFILIRG